VRQQQRPPSFGHRHRVDDSAGIGWKSESLPLFVLAAADPEGVLVVPEEALLLLQARGDCEEPLMDLLAEGFAVPALGDANGGLALLDRCFDGQQCDQPIRDLRGGLVGIKQAQITVGWLKAGPHKGLAKLNGSRRSI